MITIERAPLGGFEERLLTELRAQVESQSAPAPRSLATVARRRFSLRLPATSLLAPTAAVAALLIAVLNVLPATQPTLAQAFPILAGRSRSLPTFLERILRSQPLVARGAATDRDHAYAFKTSLGTGYVVVDRQQRWLCILVPGPPHGGGSVRCETATRLLAHRYRGLQLIVPQRDHQQLVELLPKGTVATIAQATGRDRPVALESGVLAITLQRPVTIRTTINGHRSTRTYDPSGVISDIAPS